MPLHREFHYIHEPLPVGDASIPVLGHEDLMELLCERLMHSHGGTFLVTGFRGVGKTTLVLRALEKAAADFDRGGPARSGADRRVLLRVHVSVARKMEPDQLLFAVVRRIFEALDDQGLFQHLSPEVRDSLLLAYTRTSLSFTQTQSETSERNATAGMKLQSGLLGMAPPTLSVGGKKSRSRTTEAAFLAYSETDVEHDLVRIVQLLSGRPEHPSRRNRTWRRRAPRLSVHPVIVLDELDKLTDNEPGAIADLEKLLGSLKNVFSTRGAHFILIAGPDLHDRAVSDADRGTGLYESVFAWRMYVPCLWTAPERLVHESVARARMELGLPPLRLPATGVGTRNTVDFGRPEGESLQLSPLVAHLRFKSRGVPRRLLQEFNSMVMWDASERASVHVGGEEWQRVLFYAQLDEILSRDGVLDEFSSAVFVPIDRDRLRLGAYHLADWVLRSRGRAFSAQEIMVDGQLDPMLLLDGPSAERFLGHLERSGVIEVVSDPGRVDVTQFGNPASAGLTYYRLTDAYSRRVAGFARRNEDERAEHGMPTPGPGRWDSSRTVIVRPRDGSEPEPAATAVPATPFPAITRLGDRYEVRELIGAGGMGAVYRGVDLRTGEGVAIKLLHHGLAEDPAFRARFRREGEIGTRIRHPNVLRVIEAFDRLPVPALIMELTEGPSLDELLVQHRTLPPPDVAGLGRTLGQALDYLHSLGLSRIDLKPANIVVTPGRGPVVVDLGLMRPVETSLSITNAGAVMGTIPYMAPEQVQGNHVADIRSDIYALGAVLYQCVVGRRLYEGDTPFDVVIAILRDPVAVVDLPVSPALNAVLWTCLARDPSHRFQEPAQFLQALEATPEARQEPRLLTPLTVRGPAQWPSN
ncbi:serine/threonine-protein kinase [Streptomyces sp. NPDC001904]|uniref:serine/threonine-protein kinase n=1 Tax=Streptomyces sp. NPDC001904 TaxID=3154531 RepID=UPI00332FE6E8